MKRRDTLKALTLSSFGLAVGPVEAAVPAPEPHLAPEPKPALKIPGGRQKFEAERDAKLNAEKFFTPTELQTVTVLGDIIVPADAKSGSASQAGVPAFIEFMMKDQPRYQTQMRGGLRWLDNKCVTRYGKPFTQCTKTQQIDMVEQIAYTLTGFFTSKVGIADIGYVGNVPHQWDGVPADVLAKHGLSYTD